jgi:hypothetical protein
VPTAWSSQGRSRRTTRWRYRCRSSRAPPRRGFEGWTLAGLRPDGSVEGALQLVRQEGSAKQAEARDAPALPPFLRVERHLSLGLTWSATTLVLRLSPAEAALVVEIPLLEGESVTTPEVEVLDGKARLSLAPNVGGVSFNSVLATRESLVLTAPRRRGARPATAAGPIWHLVPEASAVQADPAAATVSRGGPGPASVRVAVLRPEGVPARPHHRLESAPPAPGVRSTDEPLALRSSQGQHRVRCPRARRSSVSPSTGAAPARRAARCRARAPGNRGGCWQAGGIRLWRAAEVDLGAPR